jgi:drug/metabolite transporter (DMT)-like permease
MPLSGESRRSLAAIHLAVILFGFPGLFSAWISLPPHAIVLGRVAFASLFLALVLALGRIPFRISPAKDLITLFLCGVILAVHWTAFFQSVRVSSVAVGLLAYSSFPVFTVFLEPLMSREEPDVTSVLMALVSFFGVFLIVPRFSLENAVFRGVLWGLFSGATFSVLTVLNRRLSSRQPSPKIAFYQDLFACLVLLPFFVGRGQALSGRSIVLLAVLGVFCTAGAHTLFIQGLKRVKAQTASIISSLEPVYGIVLAYFFLGQVPALRTVAGGSVILGAVLWVTIRSAGKTRLPG